MMRSKKGFWVAVAVLLGATVAIGLLVPRSRRPVPVEAQVPGPPAEVILTGIIRDFTKTHPDFNVTPTGGFGHFASNTGLWLPGHQRPLFSDSGYRVQSQWRDSVSRPIAPHMAGVFGGFGGGGETLGIRVDDRIEIKKDSVVDSFNSAFGPYGLLGNYGTAAVVASNTTQNKRIKIEDKAKVFGDVLCGPGGDPGSVIESKGLVSGQRAALTEAYGMPDLAVPGNVGPDLGDLTLKGPAPVVWVGDLDSSDDAEPPAVRYRHLHFKDDARLTVEGELVVVCEELKIEKKSELELLPGASLTIYVTGNHETKLEDEILLNVPGPDDEASTTSLTINHLGSKKVKIEKKAHVYATIMAPHAELEIKDDAHLYGAYVGGSLKLEDKSGFHADAANGAPGSWNPAVLVRESIEIKSSDVDSWDSNLGPYDGPDDGGTNWGEEALLRTLTLKKGKVKLKGKGKGKSTTVHGHVLVGTGGDPGKVIKIGSHSEITGFTGTMAAPSPIPVVTPISLGATIGDREYKNGAYTLSSDLRCKKLKLEKATLEIAGDVTIRADDKVEMKKDSEIVLQPGAQLTMYVGKEFTLKGRCRVNMNTGNAQRVQIRRMSGSKGKIKLDEDAQLCAWTQGAKTTLEMKKRSEYFGSFVGDKVKVEDRSFLHVDMAYLSRCVDINDSEGEAGDAGHGGITSASTFDQWFRDVLGVNQSRLHSITLTRNGSGVYEFLTDSFEPLDGLLLGNEGEPHNSHFTYALKASFQYEQCAGQFIEFEGGDGVWLYVDGRLVLDLGGIRGDQVQYVELDRLGLDPAQKHKFDFFYANRHPSRRVFRLRTNLELEPRGLPNVNAQYD